MANIINLTPHAITFVDNADKPILIVEPSGNLARVSVRTERIGSINNIPVTTSIFGEVEGLPDPNDDTIFLVSSLVAQRVDGVYRDDVFIPNESVRDLNGRIVGCRSLGII